MLSLVAARLRQREAVDSVSDSKTVSSDDSAKRHFGQRVPLSISRAVEDHFLLAAITVFS